MTVFVRFNFYGWIVAIYLSEEKATRELSDGDYVEKWNVV
jgi:hypothetical protein